MDNTMNQLAAPAATGFGLYLRTIPTPSHLPTSSHPGSEGSGQESSNQAATQRTKWSEPKDPSLIQKYGSKEIALDAEEFPETCPPNLCADDQEHWKRLRETLLVHLPAHESSFKTDRSFRSRFSHIRKDLRGLQAVSDGTSERFAIKDHQVRAKQRAATRTRGQESGRDDGHRIRKARRSRTTVTTHEDRLREEAYRALGLIPDPEAPIDLTHQEPRRDQFAPGNIHDIGANGGFSQAVNPDSRRPQMAPSNVYGTWRNAEVSGAIDQGSRRFQFAPSNMHVTGNNEWVSGTGNQEPYRPQIAPGNAYGMRRNEEVWGASHPDSRRPQLAPSNVYGTWRNAEVSGAIDQGSRRFQFAPGNMHVTGRNGWVSGTVNQDPYRPQVAPGNAYGMRRNEEVWGAVNQRPHRPQIVPSNIQGMSRNEEVSAVEKGPGQVLHERAGWMGVVQGPSAVGLRGNGSRGYPIMLD